MAARACPPVGLADALASLRSRRVNYDHTEVRRPQWRFDDHCHVIGWEPPGPPVPGGAWATACDLVRDYDFTPPEVVRAVYDRHSPLLGRDMLLDGGFAVLRVHMGVRITSLVDETDDERCAWGWGYETLEGHLQRGQVTYRVTKQLRSGQVELQASVRWQPEPLLGPLLRLGWALAGRRNQRRFYPRLGPRLRALVQARLDGSGGPGAQTVDGADLVRVPSDAPAPRFERVALHWYHPVRRRRPGEQAPGVAAAP
jgi:hypothetical protein